MTKIEILGAGCGKCRRLAKNVDKAVNELGIQAEIVKVDKIDDIVNRGVMFTPGLFVDGEKKSTGKVLSVKQIKKLLEE